MDNKEKIALISLLDDSDEEVVEHVREKIISLGEEFIPVLEKEWESSFNPILQERIEDVIHDLQFTLFKKRLLGWKEEGGQDLLEGMWIIATYQYPDLDYKKLKQDIEQLYYEVWLEVKEDQDPYDKVRAINNVFFNKLKFGPNTKNFHSPSNSMINVVLESRKGNPISLGVLYLLVSQKLKMPVFGVNLPNLFVLTYKEDPLQFYINAFNRGLVFSREDVDNYIDQLKLKMIPTFHQPCSHLEILSRMLRNLVVSFEKIGEHDKVDELKSILIEFSDLPERP